ncbi:MAG: hypothetical protein KJ737_24960 [Proteobacteria bacterium]|nr:hypothetical protein [Pseudomonadota bacterium]
MKTSILTLCCFLFPVIGSSIHAEPLPGISIRAYSPLNGAIVFEAQKNGIQQADVDIFVDESFVGKTDGTGQLRSEWLAAGDHAWQASHEGNKAAEGQFTVKETVDIVFEDRGAIMNGEMNRNNLQVRPLIETWTGFFSVRNTGTTAIDHFSVSFICPMRNEKSMTVKLVSPPIPSWLWKPFMGSMLDACKRRMVVNVQDKKVTMKDAFSDIPITVIDINSTKPLGENGLLPGAVITVQYTEPYQNCIDGFVRSIGKELNIEIDREVVDPENNIMQIIMREYKFGPMVFKKIKANAIFKGFGKEGTCTLGLSIDDTVYDQVPWVAFEWL